MQIEMKPRRAEERKLYEAHPVMFKSNPIGFILSIILIAWFGFGLIILLIWWLRVLGTMLTVTSERITLRKGILSKNTSEVYHTDVRNVRVRQNIFQRIFGVGTIGISSAALDEIEIEAAGIPNPKKVKEIIDQYRRQ